MSEAAFTTDPPAGSGVRGMMGIINKHMKPMGGSASLKRQNPDGTLVGTEDGEVKCPRNVIIT